MTNQAFMKNAHLEGNTFLWQAGQTAILLMHGFTATTAEVRLIAEKLHQAGYTVSAPLLPGHGTHPDDLNQTRWQAWFDEIQSKYLSLRETHHQVFLIAESMGALLAIELSARYPEIAGQMLFAPAIKVKGLWMARLLSPFKTYLEKTGKEDGLPWKGYTVYPLKACVALLKLQKDVRRQLPKIANPTLVFTGEYDQTISPDSAEIILNGIASRDKGHIHLAESAHCILLDQELDQVFRHVKEFINQHVT